MKCSTGTYTHNNTGYLEFTMCTLYFPSFLVTGGFFAITSFGTGFIDDDDYPNLFSPNNDNRSDTFKILGLENYPNFKIKEDNNAKTPIIDTVYNILYANKNPKKELKKLADKLD